MADLTDPRMSAGNWWVDFGGDRFVYVDGHNGWRIRQYAEAVSSETNEMIGENPAVLHLPDCDGFDWEPPAAIDPGEGWRLLGADEIVKDGDQVHVKGDNWAWCNTLVGCKAGGGSDVRRPEPEPLTVSLITWLCKSSNGHVWTHDTGVADDHPQHAVGIIKRYTAEVEDMPS